MEASLWFCNYSALEDEHAYRSTHSHTRLQIPRSGDSAFFML